MDVIAELEKIVGERALLTGEDVRARPNHAWGQGSCEAKAIVRPACTDELPQVMALCHAQGQAVVPLGGQAGLADGTVLTAMNEMLKNNAGYDLKHLFIGPEGTLGLVTRAVLRLRPQTRSTQTALVALDCFDNVVGLLRRLGGGLEDKLSALEVMWRNHYHFLTEKTGKHLPLLRAAGG